jgi:hypothetical protein
VYQYTDDFEISEEETTGGEEQQEQRYIAIILSIIGNMNLSLK